MKNNRPLYIILSTFAAIGISAVILAGCYAPPQAINASSNSQVPVELLFEHDGIKVYRFYDAGHAIYFTDTRGQTVRNRSNGKTTTYQQVENVR